MASSSNPSPLNFAHDVFLSYLHADTGNSFTSHLKSAFEREGFNVAMSDTVDKGEEISDTVLRNISESLVSVVVFSKSYASCGQCLDELVKIWERKEENGGGVVLPVFLRVEPTHVRNRTGAFGDGFQRLIERSKQFKEKEETWKSALTKTANLSGWDSMVKSEAEIIKAIVECINKTLDQLPSGNYSNDFVGIYQMEEVKSLLQLQSKTNVQFLGIWGMGGIGKTKISKELFGQISSLFDASCFLENVRETLERKGLQSLEKKMFSQLGIDFKPSLSSSAQRALNKKRVLIILDNVSNSLQLMSFAKNLPCGSGSRIILTCRDKQVLNNYQCEVYKVQILDRCESLKLFKFHAFKGQLCHELFGALLNKVLLYCGGLPLALKLLGCHLYDKSFEEWESELAKLQNIPNLDVNDVMKISYEGLDEYNKSIFLDIACVFCGWNETKVKRILHAYYPVGGIRCLIDKALIANSDGRLRMHDLIRQFGQYIVSSESKEPGNRSRLWRFEDFSYVVAENTGSKKVEVISVDLNEGRKEMCMKVDFFDKMTHMRVINLHRGVIKFGISYSDDHGIIQLPEGLNSLPSKLISYLCWYKFPLTSFPREFTQADHLVELNLSCSRLKQLWSEGAEPHLPMLECMNLSGSKDLVKLPNLSNCVNLKTLYVRSCRALVEFPSSLQHLSKLETLHMDWCKNLAKLPMLPQSIVELTLGGTNFKELPSWIGSLSQLHTLWLSHCINLTSLPESLGSLQSVKYLRMFESGKRNVPSSIGQLDKGRGMVSLHTMNLEFSGIESLPTSIMHLPCLTKLTLRGCKNLKYLPDLPSSLEELDACGCTSLTTVGNILGEYDGGPFLLDMVGCFNLDQNSRIRCLAIAQARLNAPASEALFSRPYAKFREVLLPGNEVPDWFKYKATGSSIEVELLGGMLIEHLRQPTICVVIDDLSNIMGISSGSLLQVLVCYTCMFLTEFGEHRFISSHAFLRFDYAGGKSNHVFIFGGPGEVTQSFGSKIEGMSSPPMMCSKAKFEFEVHFLYSDDFTIRSRRQSSKCKILQCGVSFPRNLETGGERDAKANMRKQKAAVNLTKESNLMSRLAWPEENSWLVAEREIASVKWFTAAFPIAFASSAIRF